MNSEPGTTRDSGSALPERHEAFVRLLALHEPMVRGLVLTLVPRWQDAAEVLQEASVVAWRKFDQFEEGTSFQNWISRIAVYEVHNFRARNKHARLQFNSELVQQLVETRQADTEYLEEQRTALLKCLQKLRASDRQLVADRYAAQRKGKQIAEDRGQPADSIYKALKRIRAQLYACITRTLAEGGER